ncbi:uncharacterized protein [Antedon mediterranea]|uniref:uncharacterized protein isoform X2 n=1 Tax=Antedon mediterranea TaxID=105859 RepID=UPI003AF7DA77
MIQMLTTVITVFPPDIEDKKMKTLWKRLEEEGILEEKLLRYLWTTQNRDHFEIFIEVMRVFWLLYEKKSVQEGNREFLVPCRMKVFTNTSLEVTKDDMHMVSIYLTPTDFLPEAVYHTLVVVFLELMNGTDSDDSKVFRNRSDFEFKDHKVSLGAVQINRENEKPHAIKLQIYRRTENSFDTEVGGAKPKKRQLKPSVCMEVLSYLRVQLQTVCNIYERSGYNLRVVCDACNPKEHHLVYLEKCLKNDVVPCGEDTTMNTAHIKRYFSKGVVGASSSTTESEPEADQAKLNLVPRENEEHEPVLEVVQVRVSSPGHQENQKVNKMTDLNEHFNDLKANLSKHYAGDHYRLVKLCLYDHLPLGDFEGRGLTAHNLFNKLQAKGYIEPSNVKLLMEIAKLT